MRIDRMLSIVVLLLNRERITAKELAGRFEVSIRTVYRDIDAINLAGIPVVSFAGNNGGFGIMPNYKLDKQYLSLNDMVSILTALKGIQATFNDENFDSAIEKINNIFPKDKDVLNNLDERLIFDFIPWGDDGKQKNNLKLINSAISQNKVISFLYRNSRGESVNRKIEPMTLIFKGYSWYVSGFCLLKNAFRLFRLSRINKLVISDEFFTRKNISIKDIFKDGGEKREIVNFEFEFTENVRHQIEDNFAPENITYLENGKMIVKTSFPMDNWVYSFILSFGENLKVISPLFVKEKIAEIIKEMNKIYQT
jgi:predicted DNA-binding transcriptional regulator YafY